MVSNAIHSSYSKSFLSEKARGWIKNTKQAGWPIIQNNVLEIPHINEVLSARRPKSITLTIRFNEIYFDTHDEGYIPIVPNCVLSPDRENRLVPVNITVIKLPYTVDAVNVTVVNASSRKINIPGRILSPMNMGILTLNPIDTGYSIVPRKAFIDWTVYSGRDPVTLKRQKFLVIRIYPLSIYNDNSGELLREVTLSIEYSTRTTARVLSGEEYDVLIITSRRLEQAAEKLRLLKEKQGFRVLVGFIEDIYKAYEGRDAQEKIRNYIKGVHRDYNIKYVIILGDMDVVPVRYAYIPDGAFDSNPKIDGVYVETDLYYADLDYTWDDNDDGLWGDLDNDKVDGFPDVFVGRIPVSNLTEALAVVKKIANYEPVDVLYSKVLFAGTDTFMMGYPEGEYLLDFSEKFVKEAKIVKIYETFGNLTRTSFIREMDKGYSLVAFTGHGLPDSLILSMSQTYTLGDALAQKNKILPVFVALSCDAGRFAEIDGIGEALITNPNGGAIAFIGSTRIAWGYIGEYITTGLMGEMFWRTIKNLYNEALGGYIGNVWAMTVSEYIKRHPIDYGLAGYYIDWKTVAEYNLLGDPTLSIATIERQTNYTNGLTIENTTHKITNTTVVLSGDLNVRNSTLILENATVILNDTELVAVNSCIEIRNSILIGESIWLNDSVMKLVNASIISTILPYGSTILANETTIDTIYINDTDIELKLINLTTLLVLDDIVTQMVGWTGYVEYANLSIIGLNGEIRNSYVGLGVLVNGKNITVEESTIEHIVVVNGELWARDARIGVITLRYSALNSTNSSMTVELVLEGLLGENISLPNGTADVDFGVGNLHLILEDTNITSWIVRISDSHVHVADSEIAQIIAENSSITILNSSIFRIEGTDTVLRISNTSGLMIHGSFNITVSNSTITTINIDGEIWVLNSSRVYTIHGADIGIHINCSRIYQVYALGNSTIWVNGSVIVQATIGGSSSAEISYSRMGILDCIDRVRINLNNTDVLYWLKINDNAQVNVSGGRIWFGLVIKNRTIDISDLASGFIEKAILAKNTYGWEVHAKDITVLGWDIISYDSNISIENSEIGWIFAYYSTRVDMYSSVVSLLRLTHNSSGDIYRCRISRIIVSGYARLSSTESVIGSIYLLGHSRADIVRCSCYFLIGMAIDAEVNMSGSYCEYIGLIENITANIDNSILTVYMAFSDIVATFSNLTPGYYALWDSELELKYTPKWRAIIRDSWLSWALDLENSTVTVKDSLLVDLYLIESEAQLDEVKVSSYFVAVNSNVTLRDSSIYGIDISWGSNIALEDSIAPTLFVARSNITSYDSLITVIFNILNGTHVFDNLRPGYYDELRISIPTERINVRVVNTSVYGWGILANGIYGRPNVSVKDSVLVVAGVAYNASIAIENTLVYGYTEILTDSRATSSIKLRDVVTRMYLYVINYEEGLEFANMQDIAWNLSGNIGPWISMDNVTIYDFIIDLFNTNITVEHSTLDSIGAMYSGILIEDSNVSSILATSSKLTIKHSNISLLSCIGCETDVEDSSIDRFRPVSSSAGIKDSEIGLDIVVMFSEKTIEKYKPSEYEEESLEELTPAAMGSLSNVHVKEWFITVEDFSSVTIKSSRISQVAINGYNTSLNVEDSVIGSIKIEYRANVRVEDSKVGLGLTFKRMHATIKHLKTGVQSIDTDDITEKTKLYWNIRILETNISWVNVSIVESIISIEGSSLTLVTVENSIVDIDNLEAVQLVGRVSVDMHVKESNIRILAVVFGAEATITDSSVGLVGTYIYDNVRPDLEKKEIISNVQTSATYRLINSELIDWMILASYTSNVTVENTTLFTAYTDGFAKLWLIDSFVEYPLDALDLSEIHVLHHLLIEVRYDLMRPKTANIRIEGNETSISKTVTNGILRILLHQALIREKERKDLGYYTITAKVGYFSTSRKIYLWKPMKLRLQIIGPLTIGIIAAVVFFMIFVLKSFRKTISSKLRERVSPLFKRTEKQHTEPIE